MWGEGLSVSIAIAWWGVWLQYYHYRNKLTARGLHRVGGIILCTRCYQDRDKEKKVGVRGVIGIYSYLSGGTSCTESGDS